VKTTGFKITDAKKKALVDSGRKGTKTYLKWFDDPASKPAKRV
jgi:NTE family protein